MSNKIGAIKIYLPNNLSDRVEIGLYATGSTCCLRWSESQLYGVADAYNYEMLLRGGIGETKESVDITQGGNNVIINSFQFYCKGTNQLGIRFDELEINISGTKIEYIEFEGTDADSDSVSETVMFQGVIDEISYNQFETVFMAKSSFEDKRNKFIGKIINSTDYPDVDESIDGDVAPIVFGRSDPDNGRYFKLPRLEYKSDVISNTDIMPNGRPTGLEIFPAVAANPTTDDTRKMIRFLIGEGRYSDDGDKQAYDIESKYIQIVSGSTDADGETRSVLQWITDDISTPGEITYGTIAVCVELDDVFSEWIPVYDSGTQTYHAFCKILDLFFTYIMDTATCECLVSGSFYIKNGEVIQPIMNFELSQINSGVPLYRLEPRSFTGTDGSIEALMSYPASDVYPYDTLDHDLLEFGIDGDYKQPYIVSPAGYVAGVFCEQNSGCFADAQGTITGATYFSDKNRATSWEFDTTIKLVEITSRHDYYLAFMIDLPVVPDDIEFDKDYFWLDLLTTPTCDSFKAQEFLD